MRLFAILFVLLIAAPALAQPADIYPPLQSGSVALKALAAASDPASADTASIGLVQLNAPGGEVLIICAPDVTPGISVLFQTVIVENPGDGSAGAVKARGYAAQGCTGDLTTDSVNTAYILFVGPGAPAIIPSDGTADIVIP